MIEHRLREASDVWFPPTPAIAEAARAQLPEAPETHRRPSRRLLAIALAALVVTGTAVAASLDLVPGIRIRHVERLPEVRLTSPPPFGREVALSEATRGAGFTLLLPRDLGSPDRLYLDRDRRGSPIVTAVYGGNERARLVLTQWTGRAILFDKLLTFPGRTEYVDVGGAPGVWIEGPEHAVFYLGSFGAEERIAGYLAGNVLSWQRGRVSYRLEAGVSQRRALELAATLRAL
jgi:hypothetical protein